MLFKASIPKRPHVVVEPVCRGVVFLSNGFPAFIVGMFAALFGAIGFWTGVLPVWKDESDQQCRWCTLTLCCFVRGLCCSVWCVGCWVNGVYAYERVGVWPVKHAGRPATLLFNKQVPNAIVDIVFERKVLNNKVIEPPLRVQVPKRRYKYLPKAVV